VNERGAIRQWVQTWQSAAPELEIIRRREVVEADLTFLTGFGAEVSSSVTRTQPDWKYIEDQLRPLADVKKERDRLRA
jgi:hypothetical protein